MEFQKVKKIQSFSKYGIGCQSEISKKGKDTGNRVFRSRQKCSVKGNFKYCLKKLIRAFRRSRKNRVISLGASVRPASLSSDRFWYCFSSFSPLVMPQITIFFACGGRFPLSNTQILPKIFRLRRAFPFSNAQTTPKFPPTAGGSPS